MHTAKWQNDVHVRNPISAFIRHLTPTFGFEYYLLSFLAKNLIEKASGFRKTDTDERSRGCQAETVTQPHYYIPNGFWSKVGYYIGNRVPYGYYIGNRAPYGYDIGNRVPYGYYIGNSVPYGYYIGNRVPYGY